MKKLLISILIALLIILGVYIGLNGVKIGNFEILGIKGIQAKNDKLDTEVESATRLASVEYKKAVSEVQENAKKLSEEKKNYEDITILNTDTEGQVVTQIQKYEIETLWVKLGNYATSEGATIKIEVTKGSNTTEDTYNLNFTANGSYISITDFISDIENDSTLGFKIEDFKMIPAEGDNTGTLQATFTCKDIAIIDVEQTRAITSNDSAEESTESTKNTNTTNSSNTTNSTNTANSTNATNKTTNTNSVQ